MRSNDSMVIFIDDRPIHIISKRKSKDLMQEGEMDLVLDARLKRLQVRQFKGHTCILNIGLSQLEKLFEQFHSLGTNDFHALYLVVEDKKEAKEKIKSFYQVIEAAGGVVRNSKGQVLMIYRLGKWDLPKGKLEKNENFRTAAVREVLEECRVLGQLEDKICSTYHTYTHRNQRILKLTKWYAMDALSDERPEPQISEGIEKVDWQSPAQIKKSMTNTYSSIRFVLEKYRSALQSKV